MSELKITPGNWTVESRMACGEGWAVASDHDFPTETGKTYRKYVAQLLSLEDARAIAAMPDMIAALRRCIAYIEADEMAHGRAFGEGSEARAALAKAMGN